MVIIFSNELAMQHLRVNGSVYTFRKGPKRKTLGKDWLTNKRGNMKLADVQVEAIEEIDSGSLWLKLDPYHKQSGFMSTDQWILAIAELNKGDLPEVGWLYKVTLLKEDITDLRKACDVCDETEKVVLTKHHYTRQERHILKIRKPKSGRKWTWRCANCHLAFNKLGVMKFYEGGGYWDTLFSRVMRQDSEVKQT